MCAPEPLVPRPLARVRYTGGNLLMHFEAVFVTRFTVATAVALAARWLKIPYAVAPVVKGGDQVRWPTTFSQMTSWPCSVIVVTMQWCACAS